MDVRFDQRRRDQTAAEIDGLDRDRLVPDGDDDAVIHTEIGEHLLSGNPGIAKNQIDHLAIMARPAAVLLARSGKWPLAGLATATRHARQMAVSRHREY